MKKIVIRRELDQRERFKEIVEKVANKCQIQAGKYVKMVDPEDYAEISRRFAILTEPFISDCLQSVNVTLQDLKIQVSAATSVRKLLSLMNHLVVILPEIGPSKCVFLRKRVAEFMVNIINQITMERLKNVRRNWEDDEIHFISDYSTVPSEPRSRSVSVCDATEIIGESSLSFEELMQNLKCTSARKIEKTVSEEQSNAEIMIRQNYHIFSTI